MTMQYEIGWHSGDEQVCHVALTDKGGREDLFDVQLYGRSTSRRRARATRARSTSGMPSPRPSGRMATTVPRAR
jgi:hypothetical protein